MDALLGPPETGWVGGARDGGVETRFARGGRLAREQRDQLLPALHALQSGVGWISEGGLNYVCQRLTVPPAEAYGVATFYAMFSVEPRPGTVSTCATTWRAVSTATRSCAELERTVGPPDDGARADAAATWVRSPCLGMCERAPGGPGPAVGEPAATTRSGRRRPRRRSGSLLDGAAHEPEFARPTDPRGRVGAADVGRREARAGLRLLRRVGVVDPTRSTTTGRTAGTRRCGARTSSGPRA